MLSGSYIAQSGVKTTPCAARLHTSGLPDDRALAHKVRREFSILDAAVRPRVSESAFSVRGFLSAGVRLISSIFCAPANTGQFNACHDRICCSRHSRIEVPAPATIAMLPVECGAI